MLITQGSLIDLYRCRACKRLLTDRHVTKWKGCKCGSRNFFGGSPVSILENIKCWIWAFTLK
jgi:DNA-directed RNA polymerase subunit RPC12/RpoP